MDAIAVVPEPSGEVGTSLVLTIIGPTVIALWMLIIGVLLWRRSPG